MLRAPSFTPLALSLVLAAAACSSADSAGDGGFDTGSGLNPGVGQGGAQDFGLFREILLAGEIPGPETIDDLGFFAEHEIELPSAECGDQVCIHGMLGVMGNMISGSNCTVVLIGMNTPIDPAMLERPPLNLAIAVDLSGSMIGEPIERLRDGLQLMRASLQPEDRVTIVSFGDDAELLVQHVAADDAALTEVIETLEPGGSTNIYAGLRLAFETVDADALDGWQNRVLLVSDGVATAGLTGSDTIEGLAEAWAEQGYGLTTIGIGDDFDVELMRTLAELGSGSFYYVEDPSALEEVFVEEVEAFTFPLAEDVRIDATVFEGYDLRNVYGTKQAEVYGNEAHIEIPILQIAHRTSDEDNENGRRGGGGAMLLELLPTGEDPGEVGRIDLAYTVPVSGETVEQFVEISSPLGPWETPPAGYFSGDSVAKGFVMLNIYIGFELAAERASVGDDAGALSILDPLSAAVEGWLDDNPDADIEDDLFYLGLFIDNLGARTPTLPNTPSPAPEPWPND